MRLTSLVLAVSALSLAAVPAFAGSACDYHPPAGMHAPNVPFEVHYVPAARVGPLCNLQPDPGRWMAGCTTKIVGYNTWLVIINENQSRADLACTLAYEEAHLPPNNWKDPAMESTMHPITGG